MKKALIVLLILALAGGLFAQDISFSGHVQTGMFIDILKADDDVHVRADDDDAGVPVRADFTAAVDDGNWGAVIGFRSDTGNAYVHNAYGWLKPVDMLKISAGIIDDGIWGTRGELDDGVATGGGLRFEIMPIDGLNLGAFFSYPHGTGVYAEKIGNFFGETAFGFEYEADAFYVSAALKLFSEETDGSANGYENKIDDTDMKLIFGAGVNLGALALELSGKVDHLGSYGDVGWAEIYEEAKFGVSDALQVGLLLGEALQGPDPSGLVGLKVKPWVEFAVNDAVSVGADVGVEMWDIGDGLGLARIFGDLWGKYTIGGGWMQAGYGFENLTKDYGDALNHYIKLVFGFDF